MSTTPLPPPGPARPRPEPAPSPDPSPAPQPPPGEPRADVGRAAARPQPGSSLPCPPRWNPSRCPSTPIYLPPLRERPNLCGRAFRPLRSRGDNRPHRNHNHSKGRPWASSHSSSSGFSRASSPRPSSRERSRRADHHHDHRHRRRAPRRLPRRSALRRAPARRVLRHLDLDHRDRRLDHPARDLPRGSMNRRQAGQTKHPEPRGVTSLPGS